MNPRRPGELDDYLRCSTPPLDAEAERRFIALAQGGDATAMERLIRGNLPWIAKVAARTTARGLAIPLEDAVQEGVIGFMDAVREFDPTRGKRLNTIATRAVSWAIRHANPDYLRIRLNSHWMQPKWAGRKGPEARERAALAMGCGSETEIATADDTPAEGIYGGRADPALEAMEAREEARVTLGAWLPRLEGRDRDVVELKHGEGRSFAEIGSLIGVSKARAAQIEAKAMKRLRFMARVGVGA